jgi:Ca2+-binding RTX toxin-like protein
MANLPDTDILAKLGLSPHGVFWDWEGGARSDTKTGGAGIDLFFGEGGNDTINGAGGNDYIEGGASALLGSGLVLVETLNGGAGIDTISYLNSTAGVNVSLLAGLGVPSGGDANGDVLTGFENIVGSQYIDTLNGDLNDSVIFGMGGADTINGNAGNDNLWGGDGNDIIQGGAGADEIDGGYGDDVLYGGDGNDQLYGGEDGADLQYGGNGNDTFYFSHYPDTMDGGPGIDTVDYSASPGLNLGAVVNLKTGVGGRDVEGDSYISIENVIGTDFNDEIWGNASANTLDGGSKGKDNYIYTVLADINGDRINHFDYVGSYEDNVVLTGLGITFDDITSSRIGGGITRFAIAKDGQSYYIDIDAGIGLPSEQQVFIL